MSADANAALVRADERAIMAERIARARARNPMMDATGRVWPSLRAWRDARRRELGAERRAFVEFQAPILPQG